MLPKHSIDNWLTRGLLFLCLALTLSFPAAGSFHQSAIASDDVQAAYLAYLPLAFRPATYDESTGILDETFGGDGLVASDGSGGGDDYARALALQPDGKIIAAGHTNNGVDYDFALARYNPDGSLDGGFDADGWQTADLGGNEQARAVVLQPDGKILLAGYTDVGIDFDFALLRYNPDGSLDATFSGDGIEITDLSGTHESAFALTLQPDGKILVAGFAFVDSDNNLAVVRYNPDGSLDTSFGGLGWVSADFNGNFDLGYALGLQPDGKIVAAGVSTLDVGDSDIAVVRFLPDGSLDRSFDSDGWLLTDFTGYYDRAKSLVIQPDGKIVVAGDSNSDFALVRYNSDGSLDVGFNEDGLLLVDFYSQADVGNAITLQPDGKLVMAGITLICKDANYAMVRLTPNGNLDRSFDGDGLLISNIFEIIDQGFAILQQPDGKLVLAGNINNGSDDDFMVVRYK
jgi:uncharacterized delta-60 repeat protein